VHFVDNRHSFPIQMDSHIWTEIMAEHAGSALFSCENDPRYPAIRSLFLRQTAGGGEDRNGQFLDTLAHNIY